MIPIRARIIAYLIIGIACLIAFLLWSQFAPKPSNLQRTSVEEIRASAENGNSRSQYELGSRYEFGEGVEQNYQLAAEWYRKAAESGDARGQHQIAKLHERGLGVEQDYSLAMQWYTKAAEQGLPVAMANIGRMYGEGMGVEQDYNKAALWYRSAAELGHPGAQNNLANLYIGGTGVPQDEAEGAKWKERAAVAGVAEAQSGLGSLYLEGVGVEQDFIKAGRWYKLAADNGADDAADYLAEALTICKTDSDAAPGKERYCLISAGAGYAHGEYLVGMYYHSGHFLKKDHKQATTWYRRAAERGHLLAQGLLATMLSKGDGGRRNDVEAYAWFSVVAESKPRTKTEEIGVAAAQVMKNLLMDRMTAQQKTDAAKKAQEYLKLYKQEIHGEE